MNKEKLKELKEKLLKPGAFKMPEMKAPKLNLKQSNGDMKALQAKIKNFDWRSLQKFTNAQAADDLNAFLEKLPQNAGQTMLMIAGVVWCAAGAAGLFTAVQLQKVTELRSELADAEALTPMVPHIAKSPVGSQAVNEFAESAKELYKGLEIKSSGANISITAKTTNAFGQFREAVGHVQNGGAGWRVDIEALCVGRECQNNPISANLKINTVSVKSAG